MNLRGGLKELPRDDRDFSLGALIDWPRLEELPEEYECPPLSIKDQIGDGFDDGCAAAAGTGMIEPKEETELFYPFLFAAAKYESGEAVESWGLTLRDVGKGLTKWGVPEIKDVPEEIRNLPPGELKKLDTYGEDIKWAARKHLAETYFFIPDGPYDFYDDTRAALYYFKNKKQNIQFGLSWGWPLDKFILDGTPGGFGHSMYLNGWEKNGLRVVNSAGKKTGINGRHLVSRETFNFYAQKYGLMMIVDIPREEVEYHLAAGAKLNWPWWKTIWRYLIYGRISA